MTQTSVKFQARIKTFKSDVNSSKARTYTNSKDVEKTYYSLRAETVSVQDAEGNWVDNVFQLIANITEGQIPFVDLDDVVECTIQVQPSIEDPSQTVTFAWIGLDPFDPTPLTSGEEMLAALGYAPVTVAGKGKVAEPA